ncbi:MAG: hypothetical protein ACTSQS_06295 [Promethearchaeota archaeon]
MKKIDTISMDYIKVDRKKSTRIENAPPDLYDPNKPRLGRRESEPHSNEVNYIYDVLTTNFPEYKTLWDLHHYFVGKKGPLKDKEIDIQFDISFFKNLDIPYTISSYDASKYSGKIPEMTINVLSKSTWRADLSENVEICRYLGIPVHVIYAPYMVTSKVYAPPFLRVFLLEEKGNYRQEELREVTLKEGKPLEEKNIIDVSKILPFRLGLMQLKKKHEGDLPLYRIIFIDPQEPRIFLTKFEKYKIEHEKKLLEAEKKAAEAEKKASELKEKLEKYRKKFGKIE